jgi:hypothetical protein
MLMETLELLLPMCYLLICTSMLVSWLPGLWPAVQKIPYKSWLLLVRGGGTHGNAVSLVIKGAILKKICCKDLRDETSCLIVKVL